MFKKTSLYSFALLGAFVFLSTALAVPHETDGLFCRGRESIGPHPVAPEKGILALDPTEGSEDYEEIEKRLKELLEELKRLEKDTEKKLRKEVLPRLEKEIERLKKWLRQFRMKEDDREPIKT